MTGSEGVSRARRYAYRYLKYHLLSRQAPKLEPTLGGKTVVVVGSAPFSTRPAGWDDHFRVITINASQAAAARWLTEKPDVTLMQFNQIEGQNTSAVEVRRVLTGHGTGVLIVLHWRHDLQRLVDGLSGFSYSHDELQIMDRYERIALMRQVTGKLNLELEAETKWSNGIVGAALAVHSGAARVILTGIDPLSTGHGYNDLGLTRLHATADMEAIDLFLRLGYPVHTADPGVAERTHIPLWKG